jgi:hypothetical protein
MQAAVVGAFMVRLPPATNTQSLYADRCINMNKGQRPLFRFGRWPTRGVRLVAYRSSSSARPRVATLTTRSPMQVKRMPYVKLADAYDRT